MPLRAIIYGKYERKLPSNVFIPLVGSLLWFWSM